MVLDIPSERGLADFQSCAGSCNNPYFDENANKRALLIPVGEKTLLHSAKCSKCQNESTLSARFMSVNDTKL